MIKRLINERFGLLIALILLSPVMVLMVKVFIDWLAEVIVGVMVTLGYLLNLIGVIG